jgi:hypothetical protein
MEFAIVLGARLTAIESPGIIIELHPSGVTHFKKVKLPDSNQLS